jgi:VRR-NUC domain
MQPLSPKYYLEYFQYLLRFVADKYAHILLENEHEFLKNFHALSEDEQCLFVRFVNRRGAFFRENRLKYDEIDNIPQVIETLVEKKFIERLSSQHSSRIAELCDLLTKKEFENLKIRQFEHDAISISKNILKGTKDGIIDYLLENVEADSIVAGVSRLSPIIKVNFEAETMMLKFLFFGNRHADMTEFVIRDLGIVQYQQFDEDKLVAQFATRQEAENRLRVSLAKEDFYLMTEAEISPTEIYHWFLDWSDQHLPQLTDVALLAYEHLTLRIAIYLEKKKFFSESIHLYTKTKQPPARERQVRILHKTQQFAEAKALCQHIVESPQNADEQFFAIDFLNKLDADAQKKKSKKTVTQHLHNSESISIPIDWKYRVENGVINYFIEKGHQAVFAENHLWKNMFGLLCWDIIFDTDAMAMHHPLQRSPSDLYKPTFWERRRNSLVERVELLHDTLALEKHLQATYEDKMGIANPLVDWGSPSPLTPRGGITQQQFPLWELGGLGFDIIKTAFAKIPPQPLGLIFLEMAKNMRENTHGFPDLFTWTDDDYCFVEVKSPTDSLSAQQVFWLRYFEQIGIKSKVLRVEWR